MKYFSHKAAFLAILLVLCSQYIYAQVNFVSEENSKITIRTVGVGKNKNEAIANAEQNVFYVLFYRGLPGSSLKDKLIDKPESEVQQTNKNYLDAFFNSRYQTFITSVVANTEALKEKRHQVSISLDVTVNTNALRKDLEENQVIRKFGY